MTKTYSNILCIRADNMGDIIMSTPAFNALKQTFNCRLTLLTSAAGSLIGNNIPGMEEVITADMPWVKTNADAINYELQSLIELLKAKQFDAAVIFTVYSQSALPAAMLALMAGIPERVAYCRENPYHLLTVWLPDKEPYGFIQHQVERDLQLVNAIHAFTHNKKLQLLVNDNAFNSLRNKLRKYQIDDTTNYIILHAGVSEKKREYPVALWQQLLKQLQNNPNMPVLLTGTKEQHHLNEQIISHNQYNTFNVAGELILNELIILVKNAKLVIAVNTVIVHIAAAMQTPVIVLYALTNPQHTPWMVKNEVFYFPVNEKMMSRNEVIKYVSKNWHHNISSYPKADDIMTAAHQFAGFDTPHATLA